MNGPHVLDVGGAVKAAGEAARSGPEARHRLKGWHVEAQRRTSRFGLGISLCKCGNAHAPNCTQFLRLYVIVWSVRCS